ncbi:NACHT domain-containing protein [Nostoc sp. CENA67]|uniref:NACHT domain-containing protein n=1 Tax=Amazonocrinis nigriterrae CENA67 TaxID=2794033 RepID=A0A8J7I033_9NOST|nr:NACHT domain-containing protein [Amazonocrinis nigriterrae]MBH8566795.1 NACHT domain-containing protein [Amazonocrinis nigriterrae CENA67]
MTDYNLAGLNTRSFEQLIQVIALKVVSPGVVVFGDGPDGGREATFNGRTRYPSEDNPWNGYIVIQAKFRQRPQNSQEDGEWALKQLKSELEDFANPKKRSRQPDYYIFATNVVLTPVQNKGTKDKAYDIFQEFQDSVPLKGYDIWDYDKIRAFLDNFEDIRRANAGFITSGDVLSQIMDFIEPRKELFADQYTNPEDIEVLVQKVRSHFDKTIQNECETLCTFNLLYSPMQGNLSQIYVQTKLNESQQFSSEEFSQERRLWEEVVVKNPKLMVLGKPGAGKTTLLQYIAVHCDEVDFQPKPIPVFISLRTLAENAKSADEINLMRYIRRKYCRSHISEKELEVLLDNGRLLFLLDGLDEVTEDKNGAVFKEIHHLVDEYDDNRVIVTCRKEYQAYKSKAFGNFILCKVADFEQLEIDIFIKNWFAESQEATQIRKEILANNLIINLKLEKNKRILELADTPLLLHLICLIFQEIGDLPAKRVDVYKEGINLLLEKWNQFNDRVQLNIAELRKALRRIAVITFEEGKSSFEEGEILPDIDNCSSKLSEIEVLSGLLVKKTWKTYAFSHQTFQEYLIAEELVNSQQGWRKLLIHITEPRWREVFFMAVEMLPNTDTLVRLFTQGFEQLVKYNENNCWNRWNEDSEDDGLEKNLDFSEVEISFNESNSDNYYLQDLINQKSSKISLLNTNYKGSAVRAFYLFSDFILSSLHTNRGEYLGWCFLCLSTDNIMELVCAIDSNIRRSFDSCFSIKDKIELDYCIVLAFEIAIELFDCENIEEYKLIYKITKLFESIITFSEICQSNLLESLIQLKNKLPQLDTNSEKIIKLWENEDFEWFEDFRDWIVEHRNIGNQEWIMEEELEVILRYYQTNKLLIDCLNQSQVSPEVRALIEDNLFLPLDSSSS